MKNISFHENLTIFHPNIKKIILLSLKILHISNSLIRKSLIFSFENFNYHKPYVQIYISIILRKSLLIFFSLLKSMIFIENLSLLCQYFHMKISDIPQFKIKITVQKIFSLFFQESYNFHSSVKNIRNILITHNYIRLFI